ncbi:YkgJ family cysteine cluster protein [Pseudomonas sp. KFB-139]|uniref:YkgJ family cysteine cluster protein n=1 Tax=Pseudomonas serbiensis TaxID=3064350 RepID=A0ABT9CLA9_9PSED|nr:MULTISPECIES: YkgJ family cysteine cluster protein [Pseudomonas]MDO7926274.1 YkgJ family cysteine cluster protein [Pseudomonas sp. KFB-138]
MGNNEVRFACNTCGVCCKGRLVPLTLGEARRWLERGHEVAVLLEAFDEFHWPGESDRFNHNAGRSVPVESGSHQINVTPIFAGNALTQCPNLDDQNRCGIYEERPLVCRIYPLEISPFIALDPAKKICPPEVWETGEVIFSDRVTDPVVLDQINESRRSDRNDVGAKVAICESMGMTVAAWKEDALAVYLPLGDELKTAIERFDLGQSKPGEVHWRVHIENENLRETLIKRGAHVDSGDSPDYIFYKL